MRISQKRRKNNWIIKNTKTQQEALIKGISHPLAKTVIIVCPHPQVKQIIPHPLLNSVIKLFPCSQLNRWLITLKSFSLSTQSIQRKVFHSSRILSQWMRFWQKSIHITSRAASKWRDYSMNKTFPLWVKSEVMAIVSSGASSSAICFLK